MKFCVSVIVFAAEFFGSLFDTKQNHLKTQRAHTKRVINDFPMLGMWRSPLTSCWCFLWFDFLLFACVKVGSFLTTILLIIAKRTLDEKGSQRTLNLTSSSWHLMCCNAIHDVIQFHPQKGFWKLWKEEIYASDLWVIILLWRRFNGRIDKSRRRNLSVIKSPTK